MDYSTLTQCIPGYDLCPVKELEVIKSRLQSYPKTNFKTPINTVRTINQYHKITSSQVSDILKHVNILPINKGLGLNVNTVGTHSIRCSEAMLIHSAKIKTDIIKLVGRWQRDSYMKYFRTEVQSFTTGVSNKMVSEKYILSHYLTICKPQTNTKSSTG